MLSVVPAASDCHPIPPPAALPAIRALCCCPIVRHALNATRILSTSSDANHPLPAVIAPLGLLCLPNIVRHTLTATQSRSSALSAA
jgi:hypothetical protein